MAYSELPWRPFLGHQTWSWTTWRRDDVFYYVYKRFLNIFVTFLRFLTVFIFIWTFLHLCTKPIRWTQAASGAAGRANVGLCGASSFGVYCERSSGEGGWQREREREEGRMRCVDEEHASAWRRWTNMMTRHCPVDVHSTDALVDLPRQLPARRETPAWDLKWDALEKRTDAPASTEGAVLCSVLLVY